MKKLSILSALLLTALIGTTKAFALIPPAQILLCDYEVISDWGHGFQGQVTLTNSGGAPTTLNDWAVDWAFTGQQKIVSHWNSQIVQTGNQVSVKAPAWNSSIPPYGSVSIGFIGEYQGDNAKPLMGDVCFGKQGINSGVPFDIIEGETVHLPSDNPNRPPYPHQLSFSLVTSDSRCPADTACIWEGEVDTSLYFDSRELSLSSVLNSSKQIPNTLFNIDFNHVVSPDVGGSDPLYVINLTVTRINMFFGQVRWIDEDGGFFAIIGDNGQAYVPSELPPAFQADGLEVSFQAVESEAYSSLGLAVHVYDLSLLNTTVSP
ncbi:MAG: hypothetical protein COA42_08160 [Alteromonadaceae bacterium]|nr:MAG: hypothetical protein COA42_08160 [Alteromonadaceae bacterium]